MTRQEFMDLLKPLDAATSAAFSDHEGGYPGNCPQCAILSLLETIGYLASYSVDWDEEDGNE